MLRALPGACAVEPMGLPPVTPLPERPQILHWRRARAALADADGLRGLARLARCRARDRYVPMGLRSEAPRAELPERPAVAGAEPLGDHGSPIPGARRQQTTCRAGISSFTHRIVNAALRKRASKPNGFGPHQLLGSLFNSAPG